jgi:hypothetical protein
LLANIRLGCKGIRGANALAYLASLLEEKKRSDITHFSLSLTNRLNKVKGAPLDKALALPANIRPGCKGTQRTNALSYLASLSVEKKTV